MVTSAMLWALARCPSGPAADTTIAPSPLGSDTGCAELASTGLNLTIPILLAISVLLVGTALLGWAILRRPRVAGR